MLEYLGFLDAYKSARAGYLEQYLPNRMYQCAQPNENIPPLAPVGSSWQKMNSGESVRLEVKSSPGYPVTYVATDLGAFQNKLIAFTVEADGKGIAQATYTATPGTIGRSHVIVGSPGASGQVKFEMLISPIQN